MFLERDVHMIQEEEVVDEETQGADHKVSHHLHHQVTVLRSSSHIHAAVSPHPHTAAHPLLPQLSILAKPPEYQRGS